MSSSNSPIDLFDPDGELLYASLSPPYFVHTREAVLFCVVLGCSAAGGRHFRLSISIQEDLDIRLYIYPETRWINTYPLNCLLINGKWDGLRGVYRAYFYGTSVDTLRSFRSVCMTPLLLNMFALKLKQNYRYFLRSIAPGVQFLRSLLYKRIRAR